MGVGTIYVVLASIIGGYFFSKSLKKINYDLKGFEILIYQLAFLFVFHLGKYFKFDYYQNYIGLFLFAMTGVYFLLRSVKKNKCIETFSLCFLILSVLLNYISVKYIPYDLNKSVYSIIGLTIFMIIIIDFMVIFCGRTNLNLESKTKKSKIFIIALSLFSSINLIYGFIGNKLLEVESEKKAVKFLEEKYSRTTKYILMSESSRCNQFKCYYKYKTSNKYEYYDVEVEKGTGNVESEFKHCLTKSECKEKAIEISEKYLTEKYGKFDYDLDKEESHCYYSYCSIVFDSKYTDEPFEVEIDRDTYIVLRDDFLYLYFSKLLDEDIYSVYSLEKYASEAIEEKVNEEYIDKYEIEIDFGYSEFKTDLDKMYFGKLPTLEDLQKNIQLDIYDITIKKVFTIDQLNEFNEYIITIYEEFRENYMIDSNSLFRFYFDYRNPFCGTSTSYLKSGYIRDAGSSYMIYTQATPTIVDKK